MNKLSTFLFATAMVLTVVTTLPASAADRIVTKSEVVRYSDLDLSSEAGARTLYNRIRSAARKVCAETSDQVHLEQLNYRGCYNKAVDEAVAKVNRPTLWAMHRSSGNTPSG